MPPTKNQSGRGMWPFDGMSLSSATLWGDIANLALLVCLVGGVIATFVIVRTTNVKELHWDVAREHSRERIAELVSQGEQQKKETAEAITRQREAELKLAEVRQKLGRPREVNGEKFKAALVGVSPRPVVVSYAANDPDSL